LLNVCSRVRWIVVVVLLAAPSLARSESCGELAGDAADLATAREQLAATCECAPGSSRERAEYLRCATAFAADAAAQGVVRAECRQALRSSAIRSTCGREAGSVVCCGERSSGDPSCRIARSAESCLSGNAERLWVGESESCFDGCAETCASATDCDDGNACTTDSCDLVLGCTHEPIAGCGRGGPTSCSGVAPSTWEMDNLELQMMDLINAERARHGLRRVTACRSLAKAAQEHSADMRDKGFTGHMSSDGSSFVDRVCNAGFGACHASWLGEIMVWGFGGDIDLSFDFWLGSPAHLEIMLNPSISEVGIGHACGGSWGHYWTADFAAVSDPSCD
jgi:hypothetical protein